MRLLYVIPEMEAGGAQRLLADLMLKLALNPDCNITLAIYNSIENPSPLLRLILNLPSIKVVSINIPLSSRASINPLVRHRAIRRLRALISEADICHAHLFPALYDVAIAAKGLPAKLIFTEHSTYNKRRKSPIFRGLEKHIYQKYDAIIAVSQAAGHALEEWIGSELTSYRLHTIENGIQYSRFAGNKHHYKSHSDLSSSLSQDAYSLTEEFYEGIEGQLSRKMADFGIKDVSDIYGKSGIPILMISRFAESKNQEGLIRAFHILKTDATYKQLKSLPPIFLAFAGDGPTHNRCMELAKSLSLENDILFLGERYDTPLLIASAAVGAQISHWEGAGITAIEMMAGGLPIVVSDLPPLRHTVNGAALLTSDSPAEIARNLAAILNPLSPEEFNVIQLRIMQGRKNAKRHDISYTALRHLDLYRSVMGKLMTPANI